MIVSVITIFTNVPELVLCVNTLSHARNIRLLKYNLRIQYIITEEALDESRYGRQES